MSTTFESQLPRFSALLSKVIALGAHTLDQTSIQIGLQKSIHTQFLGSIELFILILEVHLQQLHLLIN